MRNTHSNEPLWLATLVGITATCAAPWLEMRGAFAAWRIREWHTFWHGENAFMLGEVVAANYRMTIEFATTQMQDLVRNVFIGGAVLGTWHTCVLLGLLVATARARARAGASRRQVARDLAGVLIVNLLVLGALTWLFALPSSLDTKVDFRTGADVHTDSLIWSSVQLLPVAPIAAALAVFVQMSAFIKNRRAL